MIEQSIYFSIGCIVTALLALAFGPIFWSRALRLTQQRLQLQVPLSMQEILADRDQLRAQFAVERVRLEQSVERVHAGKAKDMADIGRRTMEAATLADKLAASKAVEAAQDREIELLHREAAEAAAEIGSSKIALHGAHGLVDNLKQQLESATRETETLRDETQERRATIASLETRTMGLEMRLLDRERAHAATEKRNEAALRSRLEAAMGHATRHEASAVSLQRERDEAKAQARGLEQELDAALERERGGNLQRSLQAAKAGEKPSDAADQDELARLRAETIALQGALEVARREREVAATSDEHDAGLRASIHSLGLAVALLSREARDPKLPRPAASRAPDHAVSEDVPG